LWFLRHFKTEKKGLKIVQNLCEVPLLKIKILSNQLSYKDGNKINKISHLLCCLLTVKISGFFTNSVCINPFNLMHIAVVTAPGTALGQCQNAQSKVVLCLGKK
jgi:hypothetical protein